jgi:hypothetical protein
MDGLREPDEEQRGLGSVAENHPGYKHLFPIVGKRAGIAVDTSGDVYVTRQYQQTVNFNPDPNATPRGSDNRGRLGNVPHSVDPVMILDAKEANDR